MLEDGSVYEGTARGDFKETACEIVFNTSMTGYVEILTDPSYAGQGVVMTYPMIGNYGISREDFESERLQPSAFIVHELSSDPSNFRCTDTIENLLKEYNIPCISGVDTRAVVKKLRESGTMRGVLTSDIGDRERLMDVIRSFRQIDLVGSVTAKQTKVYGEENTGAEIALMDFGTKRNIINNLVKRNCIVTVYPSFTSADEIIKTSPDGIMLSNGLVALSGTFLAQYQGFADVKMGQGAIVIGLAAMIIGEALFSKIFKNFALRLLSVAFGSIIYYIVIQAVITVGFDANLLKLLSAVIVAIFLAIPYWKRKYAQRYVKKPKGEQKNA